MLKMQSSACVHATPEVTWNVLADLENISVWSEPVLSAECRGNRKKGLGTERVCDLGNGLMIVERWVSWNEGVSYCYEGFNLPLVNSARNTWSIRSINGKTLITTESEIILKGGFLGRLIEPIVLHFSNKMAANALAAFKYLVENGEPYEGKHSKLPRAPTLC
ncbi:MAG: SRPBCC family protein [Neptuniibacter sp.]